MLMVRAPLSVLLAISAMNYCDGFAARFRASVAEAYINHREGLESTLKLTPSCDL